MKQEILNLKFVQGKQGEPVANYDKSLVLLDKYSPLAKQVRVGESWDCSVFFVKPTRNDGKFYVVKPIKRTAEADPTEVLEDVVIPDANLSAYQDGVVSFVRDAKGNLIVPAVAGGGKTFTLLQILKVIPRDKKVLFLAFNKDIVEELQKKIPRSYYNVTVKTCHSFGFQSLKNAYKLNRDNINDGKYRDIAKTISQKWDMPEDGEKEYVSRVVKLAELARLNLVNNAVDLEALAERHEIELTNGECKYAIDLIKMGMRSKKTMDFTDMVFMPNVMKDVTVEQFDVVLIDECQDLNNCQRELMLKAVNPKGGRFVAVGDPKQAIYGFAGADINSYNTLKELPNTTELPLSICYRCDKKIIEMAQGLVPYIEARPDAPDGIVNTQAEISDITDADMVLCRNTFPLVKLCLQYLAEGKKAFVKGVDIGMNLVRMIENTNQRDMADVFESLDREARKIMRNIMRKENLSEAEARETKQFQAYMEKVDVIKLISQGLNDAIMVTNKIKSIFEDEKEGIALSTIHKSKGLEADRVFIIHPELMPSKWAKKDWMMEQEYNLMYVAYTRAKHYLGFVSKSKFNAFGDTE